MTLIPRLAAGAALAALTLAVGLPTADAQPSGPAGGPSSCFYLNQVDQVRADGDRTIYARVSGRRYYRIDLQSACPGLEGNSTPPVMSAEPTGQVCGPMNLNIRVEGSMCTPRSITPLTDADVAALPKSVRP
jgi:hypothetical protein